MVGYYFPHLGEAPVAAREQPWILFDRAGDALEVGMAPGTSRALKKTLEARYQGIHIAETTESAVTGGDGHPLLDGAHGKIKLECLWLAVG